MLPLLALWITVISSTNRSRIRSATGPSIIAETPVLTLLLAARADWRGDLRFFVNRNPDDVRLKLNSWGQNDIIRIGPSGLDCGGGGAGR